jgi:hypothetical protein
MSNVQEVRKALAEVAPQGLNSYSTTPGSAELPAMVVGLPESWDPSGTLKHKLVTFPVYVAVNGDVGNDYESQLFDLTDQAIAALKAASKGPLYQGLSIETVREFGLMNIGNGEVLASTIIINVYILN